MTIGTSTERRGDLRTFPVSMFFFSLRFLPHTPSPGSLSSPRKKEGGLQSGGRMLFRLQAQPVSGKVRHHKNHLEHQPSTRPQYESLEPRSHLPGTRVRREGSPLTCFGRQHSRRQAKLLALALPRGDGVVSARERLKEAHNQTWTGARRKRRAAGMMYREARLRARSRGQQQDDRPTSAHWAAPGPRLSQTLRGASATLRVGV